MGSCARIHPDSTSQEDWQDLRRERDRLLELATSGQVLSSILHELKNPLASISTAVELLIEEQHSEELQVQLHAILSEIRRMVITMDGLGARGRDLRTERYAAVDLAVMEVAQVLRRRAEGLGVDLACDVRDLPVVQLDPSGVRAIVFNLVNNAIQACSANDRILVRAHIDAAGPELVIAVSDSGCGMDPEALAQCTEMFFTTKTSGSGIGLTFCRELATTSGGDLAVESSLGEGTTVTVRLPLPHK